MTIRILKVLFLALSLPGLVNSQDARSEQTVYVDSWKKGVESINDQSLRIVFDAKQKEYTSEIVSRAGKKYRLTVVHRPIDKLRVEHWRIDLQEITTSDGREALCDNLLRAEGPGPGGDNFPREDLAGYLYPEREPPMLLVSGVPFREGIPFYPMRSIRKIRVEGFYVIATVLDFQFSKSDKNNLTLLDLLIEFKSACGSK